MIRTYRRTEMPDGTVVVESHGPLSRGWRAARIAWAVVFILAALICMVQGQWGPGGVALLVGAIVLPTLRRGSERATTRITSDP